MTPDDLKHYLAALGLTRHKMAADFIGVSAATLTRWKRGERPVPATAQKLLKMAVELKRKEG